MNQGQAREFIASIVAQDVSDWDCAAVSDALARYVDIELSGVSSGKVEEGLVEHLDHCDPCEELHAALLEIARLEQSGGLPAQDALWRELSAMVSQDSPKALASSPDVGQPPIQAAGRFGRWLAPAAAAAMLLFAGSWLSQARDKVQDGSRLAGLTSQIETLRVEVESATARAELAEQSAASAVAAAESARVQSSRNQSTIELISRMEQNRLDLREDGSWARVFYNPGMSEAVVYVGDMEPMLELEDGQYLECWLKLPDGRVYSAGVAADVSMHMDHWTIEASAPFGDHDAFMVTVEPEHVPLFEIALTSDS